MNLVLDGKGGTHAVGGTSRGRLFFLAPWRGATIAGTSHDPWTSRADQLGPRREDVAQLLADVNAAFPRAGVTAQDIRLVHRGLLPATEASPQKVTLLRDSPFIDHGEDGCANLFSLVGVRYTTARHSAQQAVAVLTRRLDLSTMASATAVTPLAGGDIERFDTYLRDARAEASTHLSAAQIERLVYNYGTGWKTVVAQAGDASMLRPLGAHCPVTAAEVVHAVREEMALTLSDVMLRRTEAGSRGYPGDDAVDAALGVLVGELGWSPARQQQERQELRRAYEAATLAGN